MNISIDAEKVFQEVRETSFVFVEALSSYHSHPQLNLSAAKISFPIIAQHVLSNTKSVDCAQQLQRFLKAMGSECFEELWSEFRKQVCLDYIMDHYDAADMWNEKELMGILSCWDYARGLNKSRIKSSGADQKIKDLEGFLLSEAGLYELFFQVSAKILCKRSFALNENFQTTFDQLLRQNIEASMTSSVKPKNK